LNVHKEFKRGQVVYKENQKEIDGIYLISSGEFEISQTILKDRPDQYYQY